MALPVEIAKNGLGIPVVIVGGSLEPGEPGGPFVVPVAYGVAIWNEDGIEPGGWYADRHTDNAALLDQVYAEIVLGEPGAEADVYLDVDGEMVAGPWTVTLGAPLALSGLALAVPAGSAVTFFTSFIGGRIDDLYLKASGHLA